jgi:catechol 2,3-dioxygenase-like lactoylglutathione lyase family enzyme
MKGVKDICINSGYPVVKNLRPFQIFCVYILNLKIKKVYDLIKGEKMKNLKTHISLNVSNFKDSVEFYKIFFDAEPQKLVGSYAKFDIENPPLNLVLVGSKVKEAGAVNHLGIQVETSEEVWNAKERLQKAGLDPFVEKDTVCCYAKQDKAWFTDPNGYRWEVFVVKEQNVFDAEEETGCCRDSDCCEENVKSECC